MKLNTLKNNLQSTYHYLFSYDEKKLSLFSQNERLILATLSDALLHRRLILLTYNDGKYDIGRLRRRVSAGRFVLHLYGRKNKILKIIDLSDIFRIDL